jgi:hypothetical protein
MRPNPYVKAVRPEPDFRLRLTFSNGEVRIYDVAPLLEQGGVFETLKDESAFHSVHPWHGSVQWAGGQDICPDTLYEDSAPLAESHVMAVREKRAVYRTGRRRTRKSWPPSRPSS